MTYEMAKFLLNKAEILSDMADIIFIKTKNATVASIVRQAGWSISDSVSQEHKAKYLINQISK